MNDRELERRLRTERDSREDGYAATELPATWDESKVRYGPSRTLRAAVVLPGAVGGALAAVAIVTILSQPAPVGPGAGGSASPAQSPSANAAPTACRVQDLALSAEPWGAAAGSRGTVVTVGIADGAAPCLVKTGVYARITDAAGRDLVGSDLDRMRHPDALVGPGNSHTIGIAWSNWCAAQPQPPVALSIRIEDWDQWLVVPVPPDGADPVPPCLGEDELSQLSATHLEPAL